MRTGAIGSHLDLVPTLLELAGIGETEAREGWPHLRGRSLAGVLSDPSLAGPRGSAAAPGDGALYCWDGLHARDHEWALSGALQFLTDMVGPPPAIDRRQRLREAGERFGAPDFSKRTFYRAIVAGRHKLVRWFSPLEYANPCTVRDLYAQADVSLYDLVSDSGELENLAHPDHPRHDPVAVERMLRKLHALVERELGEDRVPLDLDLFGTREVRHVELGRWAGIEGKTKCAPS